MQLIQLDAGDLGAALKGWSTSAVDQIYAAELLGVNVRGFVDRLTAASVLRKLEATRSGELPLTPIGAVTAAYTIGQMLAPTMLLPKGPAFSDYLSAAETWSCMQLFEADFHERLKQAFRQLACLPASTPLASDGRLYAAATLHVFPPDSAAPAHRDRYSGLACHNQLDAFSDDSTQISWYLVLAAPEGGGELAIQGPAGEVLHQPIVGDLLLFDGARYLHEVRAVGGKTSRITMGGFARRSMDRKRFHYWG